MRREQPSRISVRRGDAEVPLYPTGDGGVVVDAPWPRLLGEKHHLNTLEVAEHEHGNFCLHLQTRGTPELEWWCNGRNGLETPKPGSLILIPPGTRDRLRWDGSSDRFVISLEAEFLQQVANEMSPKTELSFLARWHFQDVPLRDLLGEIGRESDDGWPLGALYADMLGLSLTTLLLKRHAADPIAPLIIRGGLPMKTLKLSLEFITDNLYRDVRLTEIASVAGLSPFHFARLFRNATGQTPHQYLLEQRLRRAKEFLRSSYLPVSQVGVEVGFSNHAHFARIFRSREGVTPTVWRTSR